MKKILLIHHSGLSNGGGSRAFLDLNKILKHDYHVLNYVPSKPSHLYELMLEKGYCVKKFDFRMGKNTYYSGGNSVWNPKFYYHFLNIYTQKGYWKKIFEDEKPDLIILNSIVTSYMSKLTKEFKIPTITFVRETMKGRRYNLPNLFNRTNLSNCCDVVFLSKYDLEALSVKKSNNIVINESIDFSDYSIIETPSIHKKTKQKTLLFAGGFGKIKGLDILIKSLRYVPNDKYRLLISGTKINRYNIKTIFQYIINLQAIIYEKYIEYLLGKYDLRANVQYVGSIDKMAEFYSKGDFLIIPMRKAHQSRPVYEIGVQSKPVIISDFPSVSEFVTNEYNGIKFSPLSEKSLANAIMLYIENDELLKKNGQMNRDLAEKNHSQLIANKKVMDLIRRRI